MNRYIISVCLYVCVFVALFQHRLMSCVFKNTVGIIIIYLFTLYVPQLPFLLLRCMAKTRWGLARARWMRRL